MKTTPLLCHVGHVSTRRENTVYCAQNIFLKTTLSVEYVLSTRNPWPVCLALCWFHLKQTSLCLSFFLALPELLLLTVGLRGPLSGRVSQFDIFSRGRAAV